MASGVGLGLDAASGEKRGSVKTRIVIDKHFTESFCQSLNCRSGSGSVHAFEFKADSFRDCFVIFSAHGLILTVSSLLAVSSADACQAPGRGKAAFRR